jgi:hypothetical protein
MCRQTDRHRQADIGRQAQAGTGRHMQAGMGIQAKAGTCRQAQLGRGRHAGNPLPWSHLVYR